MKTRKDAKTSLGTCLHASHENVKTHETPQDREDIDVRTPFYRQQRTLSSRLHVFTESFTRVFFSYVYQFTLLHTHGHKR